MIRVALLLALCYMSSVKCDVSAETNAADLQAHIFLCDFDKRYSNASTTLVHKMWAHYQNVTDISQNEMVEETANRDRLGKQLNDQAEQFNLSNVSDYIKRSLKAAIALTPLSKLEESKGKELTNIIAEMTRIQSSSRPTLPSIWSFQSFASTRSRYLSSTGRKIKPLYPKYVELKNEAARLQGFKDYGEQWRSNYEQSNLEEDVLRLFDHLKPLYKALHTFVKYWLKKMFGAEVFPSSGHIPDHVTDIYHGTNWKYISKNLRPYEYKSLDVAEVMKARGYTVKKIYDAANDFYKSLGFPGMPPNVWNNSRLGLPVKGQNKICHPLAWDFHDRRDFRMSMCAGVSLNFIKLIYHEMGHLVYFQEYAHQPEYFRYSANEAFHEAVGDIMGMSAVSPEHLAKMGFISNKHDHDVIGFLLEAALDQMFNIGKLLILDLFRWGVFNASITPENYNKEWWRLQCKYTGISPPSNRSKDDFDPGVTFHVAADFSLIRYYMATFLAYNLYEQSCRDKGHTGDLHLCDISGSTLVGAKFRNFMREGSSRHWKDLLREFTGSEEVNPESITNYYKPLYTFLINNAGNETSGWNDECDSDPTVD